MQQESRFLNDLIGHMVSILGVDEAEFPPMRLLEVSGLGVVAALESRPRFFPWAEVIEIAPAAETIEFAWAPECPDLRL